ncbi:MAG: hypothetical protein PHW96_02050 [Candidatus Nanoarchaeia archaeon]|nr:hypothetical protein [Candidatus Nanoarchaeia archaeon]
MENTELNKFDIKVLKAIVKGDKKLSLREIAETAELENEFEKYSLLAMSLLKMEKLNLIFLNDAPVFTEKPIVSATYDAKIYFKRY